MKKYLKNILLRFMKLILIFMSITKKEMQVDGNDKENILFRIDIYFDKYFLAVEIDEKGHTARDLIFEEKRQKALKRNLLVHLLELILVKKIYDADYEASRIQTFISNFNKNKIKELEDTIKNLSLKNNVKDK